MCSAINVFITIVLLIVERKFANANQLTSSSETAAVGVNFTFTCVTSENIIKFTRGGLSECVITGSTCVLAVGCNKKFTYDCNTSSRVYKLTIPSSFDIDSLHGSNWKCGPAIEAGESNSITLYVNVPITKVTITTLQTDTNPVNIILNKEKTFICRTNAGRPPSKIKWYISGTEIFESVTARPDVCNTNCNISKVSSSSELTYTGIKSDDGKIIYCTALNVIGHRVRSENQTIYISYRPTVTLSPKSNPYRVLENSTILQLTCIVTDAKPAVTSFTWKKDDSKISGVGSTYTITSVHRSHAGSYTCSATNSVGSSNPSVGIKLDVLYGVELITINKKEPIEGTQLIVTCSGHSYPAVTDSDVTWTKQDNNTLKKKGKQLVLDSVKKSDRGLYICSVVIQLTPTLGQALDVVGRTTVEVNILYRPNVAVVPNYVQYSVIENTTNLELVCTVVDANPNVVSYRWYKAGFLINDAIHATYTVSTVQRSDTGTYKCDATNIVNSSDPSSAVLLNVLYGIELYSISQIKQTEGNTLTTTCSGQSNPIMTNNDVKWFKQNNNTFSREGLQLVIENLNRLDSGTYICSAVIQLTPTDGQPVNVTGTTHVHVEVLYRPTVSVVPDNNTYNVIENSTNVILTCKVTDANPVVTFFRWYKDGIVVSTAGHATYTLPTVYRYHTGNYMCDAKNDVGISDPSSALQLNVLYGVSLKLSEAEISINESERWELLCIGDGNPLPKMFCVYKYNSTIVGEQKDNVTLLGVDHANCLDTGIYMCSGTNAIGKPVTQSAYVKVGCKPRMYNTLEKQNIFIDGNDDSLNISATFISFPLSNIVWSRQLPGGNLTDIGSEFIPSTSQSQLPYETISNLQKDHLKADEFGIYLVKASNIHGSFHLKYHVIPKRAPDPPTNITVMCDVTSIRVTWITGFNGGDNQTFRINFDDTKSNQTIFKDDIAEGRVEKKINVIKESVSPDTLYRIDLEAYNLYGATKSTEITNCTTLKNQEENQSLTSAFVGGIAGSVSTLLIVVILIGGLYCRSRRNFTGGKVERYQSESNETDEDEDGLKDNPLYVTSGDVSNAAEGPLYGVVNKQKQNKDKITPDDKKKQGPVYSEVKKSNTHDGLKDNPLYITSGNVSNAEEGPVYGVVNKSKQKKENADSDDKNNPVPVHAEVQESSKHGKKKQKKKKTKDTSRKESNTDIELGTIYGNSDKPFKHTDSEELYANASEQDDVKILTVPYIPKKNKDGLIYADIDLLPGPSGNRFVIRGQENRTNYAIIDLSKKAEPLPSDNEDENNDNTYSN